MAKGMKYNSGGSKQMGGSSRKTSHKSAMGHGDVRSTNYTGIDQNVGNVRAGGGKKPATGMVCQKSKVGNRRTKVPGDRY